VRVEEVVGWQVRERREALGFTQGQLGGYLEPLLGRPWSRQAVSAAEKGERSFGAAELVALAAVLHTSVGDLLRPPLQESVVELGGAAAVPKDMLYDAIASRLPEDLNFTAIQDTLTLLAESAAKSKDNISQTLKLAQDIDRLITQRVADGGVVSAPLEHPDQDTPPIVAAIVTSDLGVLVGRRNDGKPPWTLIAGEAEPGERPEDTAIREVKEETGLRIQVGELIGERVHPATGRTMIYLTAVPTHGTDVFVGDEVELAEVRWASLAEVGELLPDLFGPVREHLVRELGEARR
jgi:8-oxo-dGTP pyrophosphatase MutT (NUDIX family)/transcriptional regulator with XRE-family HTH domain